MPAQHFRSRIPISKSALYKLLALAAVAVIVVLSFAAGYLANDHSATGAARTETKNVNEVRNNQSPQDMDDDETSPGTVRVSPEKQQLMGIKLDVVRKAPYTHLLKVPGRVTADETKIYQINAAIEGWITKIYDNTTTGSIVKKDQLLALYASPNFLSAQQAYLNALSSQERYGLSYREKVQQLSRPVRATKQYRDTLSSLGMTDTQIEQITASREWDEYIQIRTPGSGFILKRNVTQGLRFDKGIPFYTIADLSRIWIIADLYENDALYFQPGKTVRVTLPGQSKNLTARVSAILPQFDPASRTLKIRLEANNPGYRLRPDMFVDVELPITTGPGIFIPADAVLDTGLKKTVFVAHGHGSFEPRLVTTGRRLGSFVEIEQGLGEGDRIVTAGNFLLDAESKLELAAAGVNAALEIDPVCGMGVVPKKAHKAGRESLYRGKTFYFCSDQCKQRFDSTPESFLKQAGKDAARQSEKHEGRHAGEHVEKDAGTPSVKRPREHVERHTPEQPEKHGGVSAGKRTEMRSGDPSAARMNAALEIDPVCGMKVAPETAHKVGRESLYKGKIFYFCSDQCKQRFDSNPEKFLTQSGKRTGDQAAEHAEKHEGMHDEEHTVMPGSEHTVKGAAEQVMQHPGDPDGERK